MRLFKKKSSHHKSKHNENIPNTKFSIESKTNKPIKELNFEECLGRTVTVYVNAGGMAGKGFTGVLLGRSGGIVKLLVLSSVEPLCTLGNTCKASIDNIMLCLFCPFNKNLTLGAIAEISIKSIVAFVHTNN